MAVNIPGLSLSILRQETAVKSGRPLLVSGRFTAFGMGWPAFIRVFLEGPSYDPQVRTFDTFASPFSGDYSVNVLAEKDGQYNVYSQAFLPPPIPSGPPFPESILLAPPFAESTHPPIAVGDVVGGNVRFTLPDGSSSSVPVPQQLPIEFSPVISVGAPGVSVSIPGAEGISGYAGVIPPLPGAAPLPPLGEITPAAAASASIQNITLSPNNIDPGAVATGRLTWINTSTTRAPFALATYLIGSNGVQYGPLQVDASVQASPNIPQVQNLRLGTAGLMPGTYGVLSEIYDVATGTRVDQLEYPSQLIIREVSVETVVPPIGEIPPLPTPTGEGLVTPSMLGAPSVNLPSQINAGDTLRGTVNLPTSIPFSTNLSARVYLRSQSGSQTTIAQSSEFVMTGQAINIPINYPTTGLSAGTYLVFMNVMDSTGGLNIDLPLGVIVILEEVPLGLPELPFVPELPEFPSTVTSAMIAGIPTISGPNSLNLGDTWQASINQGTKVPTGFAQPLTMPVYPIAYTVSLISPSGLKTEASKGQVNFTLGQPISIPVNYSTSNLSEPGNYGVNLDLATPGGKGISGGRIGYLLLQALPQAPGLPEAPPIVPEVTPPTPEVTPPTVPPTPTPTVPSKFSSVSISFSPRAVRYGDTVTIPVTYVHVGAAESRTIRAAIGTPGSRLLGTFNEELWAEKSISVPLDAAPIPRTTSINITITSALSPGSYAIYAKVKDAPGIGGGGQVLSPYYTDVIRMAAPAATVSVLNSPVTAGEYLRFSFSNFQPRAAVYAAARGLTAPSITANGSGGGTVQALISKDTPGGSYNLVVRDAYGHSVTTSFSVRAAPAAPPPVLQASSSVKQGEALSFSFQGFQPNSSVGVSVRGGGGINVTSNSAGLGSGSLSIRSETPGSYVLEARDSYGHQATTSFNVTAPVPQYRFSIGALRGRPSTITMGQLVFVDVPVTYQGNIPVDVKVVFKFYEGSGWFTHGDFLSQTAGMIKKMSPGETYTFTGSRIERSEKDSFDVEAEVLVNGRVIASREDDDVYRKA